MKVIYTIYLKNSTIIVEETKINSYCNENFMNMVQHCIKENGNGSIKFGNTIVNINEVAAVTFNIVKKELTGTVYKKQKLDSDGVSNDIKVETLLL